MMFRVVPPSLRGFGPNGEKVGDPHPKCGYCGETEGVRWREAHTAYCDHYPEFTVFELIKYEDEEPPLPPDPNPPRPLCEECAERDKEYWDEMWREANYDRM